MSIEEWPVDKEWELLGNKMKWGEGMPPEFGPLRLDFEEQLITNSETQKSVKIAPLQAKVLWLLMRARGAQVSSSEMEYFLYRDQPDNKDLPMSNGIPVAITALRRAFASIGAETVTIQNGKNMGYSLSLSE